MARLRNIAPTFAARHKAAVMLFSILTDARIQELPDGSVFHAETRHLTACRGLTARGCYGLLRRTYPDVHHLSRKLITASAWILPGTVPLRGPDQKRTVSIQPKIATDRPAITDSSGR